MIVVTLDAAEVHAARTGAKRLHLEPPSAAAAYRWRHRPGRPDEPIIGSLRPRLDRPTPKHEYPPGLLPWVSDPAFDYRVPNQLPPEPPKPARVQVVAAELVRLEDVLDDPDVARLVLGDKRAKPAQLARWWLAHYDPVWAAKSPEERRAASGLVVERDIAAWTDWQTWKITWRPAERRRFLAQETDGGIVDNPSQSLRGEKEAVPEKVQAEITAAAQPSIALGAERARDRSLHEAAIAAARHRASYRAKRALRAPALTKATERRRLDAR